MESLIKNDESRHIKTALDRAIQNYIQSRRHKIPEFVQTHFSISGAAKINRKALGSDLIKAPLNVAWALPYAAVPSTSLLLSRVGLKKIDHLAKKMPTGFKTAVQEEINRLIFLELLELPYRKDKQKGETDALLAEILDQPEIKSLFQDQLALIFSKSKQKGFRQALEKRLRKYSVNRIAVSEMAGNIITLATGAGMLGKMTPGGISFGAGLAAAIAQQSAISSFFFRTHPRRGILRDISGYGFPGIGGCFHQRGAGDPSHYLRFFRHDHRPAPVQAGDTREATEPTGGQPGGCPSGQKGFRIKTQGAIPSQGL